MRLRQLGEELRGEAPAGLERLSDEELARLRDAVREAKRRQRESLDAAIEASLATVPGLLRRAVRRVLFP